MRHLRNTIVIIFLFWLVSSCGHRGIDFNPDFYVGDYENVSVVNASGIIIYANSPEFNGMACMTEDKVVELMKILRRARIPNKRKLLKKLKSLK